MDGTIRKNQIFCVMLENDLIPKRFHYVKNIRFPSIMPQMVK